MKTFVLIVCLALAAVACRAEDYHLIQSQIADGVVPGVKLESLTVYVLLCPDQRVYVFRAFDSHAMEEIVKYFPRGSVLHYDGSALIAPPKQAEIDKLTIFCKSKGITLELTPTN